ncbi:unnamed protein product [Dovyalis caffra]|uniref:Uncharacterized protein n=1 Tax=Dovyalis caffra TaxID=77055 RepID=A0AAV1RE39_9ROSI|nr:unnamed protein product [Dovyalis caffra]
MVNPGGAPERYEILSSCWPKLRISENLFDIVDLSPSLKQKPHLAIVLKPSPTETTFNPYNRNTRPHLIDFPNWRSAEKRQLEVKLEINPREYANAFSHTYTLKRMVMGLKQGPWLGSDEEGMLLYEQNGDTMASTN